MTEIVESPLMTAGEASEYLKVSVRTLHGLVRKGKLACIQYNQRVRHFTKEHLEEFISSQHVPVRKESRKNRLPERTVKRKRESRREVGNTDPAALRAEMRQW